MESDKPSTPIENDQTSLNGEVGDEIYINSSTLTPFTDSTLPYELNSLTWDKHRRKNLQNCYCYCGKPKTKWTPMLNCNLCKQLFHIECLKHKLEVAPLLGDWYYTFTCALCSTDGIENFQLLTKPWTDIVRVALWNLLQQEKQRNSNKRFFQYKEELCSYIDKQWNALCYGKTRTKTWENTIGSSLSTKSAYFESGTDAIGSSGFWGLRDERDPSLVKDAAPKLASSAVTKIKKKQPKKKKSTLDQIQDEEHNKKTHKLKKAKPVYVVPFIPIKKYFDPLTYKYTEQCLAKENSAPQILIYQDMLTACNENGYRAVRAAFGVSSGSWFYEIECLPHSGNIRLGWSTEKGDVQAPVGYDKYSYSYRDKEGTKFHVSQGLPYGQTYGPGDIIGCFIHLPKVESNEEERKENETPSQDVLSIQEKPKQLDPVQNSPKESNPPALTLPNSQQTITTTITPTVKKEEELKVLQNSKIIFFKNGFSQGVAFTDIYAGTYYPAASLYMGATVKFNFGPSFIYPPASIKEPWTPMCDAISVQQYPPPEEEPVPIALQEEAFIESHTQNNTQSTSNQVDNNSSTPMDLEQSSESRTDITT